MKSIPFSNQKPVGHDRQVPMLSLKGLALRAMVNLWGIIKSKAQPGKAQGRMKSVGLLGFMPNTERGVGDGFA